MIFDECDLANAVFLFSEERELIRALNYREFEALLDSYAPAMDLANRELYAAYVELNSDYQIRNVVFFVVNFTSLGFVEQNWSVPLFHLASHARPGPDLGDGPIGLVCASHTPVKSAQAFLWNPDLKNLSELKILAERVRRNDVAIHFREPSESVRSKRDEKNSRENIEKAMAFRLRKEFDEELKSTIQSEHQAYTLHLAKMRQEHAEQIDRLNMLVKEQEYALQIEQRKNENLQETVNGQADKIQGLREYFELKVRQAEHSESDEMDQRRRTFEQALAAELEEKTKELNELLEMRDVEILYRQEQETRLQKELALLRKENTDLAANGGEQLLAKMLENGVSFVTYQPGAGHITLPLGEVPRFLESPIAYVAAHCGVAEHHYKAWLEHYHVPICQASGLDGVICGENIIRIESPGDFVLGDSDRCYKHSVNKTPRLKIAGSTKEA